MHSSQAAEIVLEKEGYVHELANVAIVDQQLEHEAALLEVEPVVPLHRGQHGLDLVPRYSIV